MEKRSAAAAEPLQRRDQPEREFVLWRASQEAPLREHPCERSYACSGEASGERVLGVAIPPSWAARHSADADLDGEILAWIVSHVPSPKRLKTPH